MTSPAARVILHVDMDAFYASVEQQRDPALRNRPVVVGGTATRGVVASASYEARAYGVRSAMPTSIARRRCPDAVFIPGDHATYGEVSRRVMAIFRSVTPLVEPLSLDEAFLDVTGAGRLLGDGATIAAHLRAEVRRLEQLPCSVGVASSKFLAKLASEAAKPKATPSGPVGGAGVFVVPPGGELDFLHPLPLRALWGVGPATLERLSRLGIATVGELAALPVDMVVAAVGRATGTHLHALANGHDDRPVEVDRAARSVSHETTFDTDRHDPASLDAVLVQLADGVAGRLRRADLVGRTVVLKVRHADFRTVQRARTLDAPTDDASVLLRCARELLTGIDVGSGVRLVGIGVRGLLGEDDAVEQLALDLDGAAAPGEGGGRPGRAEPSADDRRAANEALDAIRGRFGVDAIGPATLAGGGDGIAVLGRHRPDRPADPSGTSAG